MSLLCVLASLMTLNLRWRERLQLRPQRHRVRRGNGRLEGARGARGARVYQANQREQQGGDVVEAPPTIARADEEDEQADAAVEGALAPLRHACSVI